MRLARRLTALLLTALLLTALLLTAVPALSQAPAADDLEAGKRSYSLQCAQCHGEDGDAVGYAGIVPVAGIKRRYPADVIGRLSGSFSGRVLHGRDRDRVVDYMGTLPGAKGYPDPGWLITPLMLDRKAAQIHEYRIIDTRGAEAYSAGHVANAVPAGPEACGVEETARWLGRLGVSPSTMVVVYDESGGPSAACAWWRVRQAGHEWVAVLDGGWRRWTAEGRFTTTVDPMRTMVPRIEPTVYPLRKTPAASGTVVTRSTLTLGQGGWNWEATVDEKGFRPYDVLVQFTDAAGLRGGVAVRIEGTLPQVAHLLLVLGLLGYESQYDPETSVLTVGG
jgi:rhodanese-related sulfurtransferase